jgi:hypothetical protein
MVATIQKIQILKRVTIESVVCIRGVTTSMLQLTLRAARMLLMQESSKDIAQLAAERLEQCGPALLDMCEDIRQLFSHDWQE